MFKFLILVALVPAVMLQNADNINYDNWDVIPFRPCAGARPPPATLRIENCPQMPCELRRGSSAMMVMDYTSLTDATALRPIVTATALGITAPYELPANIAAACNWLVGARCPTSVGEDLSWHLTMPITAIYPLVSVTIEIDLQDQDGQTQGCFVVDTRVVAN
ncbi:NPC intracellular cholesterol transporter 2 homolog a-like [Culex pipiens pallens]|uniref:NPC intracellular cholesterol transporter 2 homolog a-like n=1 Tax=Culex pipiens pallens TaxID=42434 RepID=UPI0019535643|nr:NPC intracellular cholesterol transporter 2 homolog a-like [Culex pipiens pallens]